MADGVADEPLFPVADLRGFLTGRWRFKRDLTDYRAGISGVMTGDAVFAAEGEGVCYGESGTLHLESYRGKAHQSYLYRFPQPGVARICFTDGCFFHSLDLTHGVWQAMHHCGADTYAGHFRVFDQDSWGATWRITGPRKDQRLSTRYSRDAICLRLR